MRLSDLHTIVDHFSLALVVLGILMEYFHFLRDQEQSHTLGWSLLKAGTALTVLSVVTGFLSESKVFMDAAARPVSNYHKLTSLIAVAILSGSVLLRILSRDGFAVPKGAALRGAYLTLITVGLFLLGGTAYFGMELVYEHGVGVRPYEHLLESVQSTTAPVPPASSPSSPSGPASAIPATGDTNQH